MCEGFTNRRIRLDPPGHLFIAPAEESLRAARRGNRIAGFGLAVTVLVLIIGIVTLIKTV